MNLTTTLQRSIGALAVTVSVAASHALAEDEFKFPAPQKALITWMGGAKGFVEVTSADSREVWAKPIGASNSIKHKADQVALIQTEKDIYTFNPINATFDSSRKREQGLPGGIWADKPQRAVLVLANGAEGPGELVLLSAWTIWFKSDNVQMFEVFGAKQIKKITTGTDSYLYDAKKGGLISVKDEAARAASNPKSAQVPPQPASTSNSTAPDQSAVGKAASEVDAWINLLVSIIVFGCTSIGTVVGVSGGLGIEACGGAAKGAYATLLGLIGAGIGLVIGIVLAVVIALLFVVLVALGMGLIAAAVVAALAPPACVCCCCAK